MAATSKNDGTGGATQICPKRPGRKSVDISVAPQTPGLACVAMVNYGPVDASPTVGIPVSTSLGYLRVCGPAAAERWTVFAVGNPVIAGVIEHFKT